MVATYSASISTSKKGVYETMLQCQTMEVKRLK